MSQALVLEFCVRRKQKSKMKLISLWILEQMINEIRRIVEDGFFPSQSELIRYALMEFIREFHQFMELREKFNRMG